MHVLSDNELMNLKDRIDKIMSRSDGPRVIFPYGFRIEEVDGQDFLVGLNQEEYESGLRAAGADLKDAKKPKCKATDAGCKKVNCKHKYCRVVNLGNSYACDCRNT